MEQIKKYNMVGLCCEAGCDKPYTHFITRKIMGMTIVLPFCYKHSEEFENNLLRTMKETRGRI